MKATFLGCATVVFFTAACSSSDTGTSKAPKTHADGGSTSRTDGGSASGGGGATSSDTDGGSTDGGWPKSTDTRPCDTSTLQSGTFDFDFGGSSYQYLVHIPPSYDGTKRTPLVLNWHGLTSNATEQASFSGMNPVSDEEGFLVVYPNSPDMSWNAGVCCGAGATAMRDDVGFARALVQKISTDACVDSKRIYSTGMSNGGFMSHMLGCEAADIFAAVAPVAGKVGIADCEPSRPVPIMDFHGTKDPLVPYDTGGLSGENLSVPDTMQHWADRDGCTGDADITYQNATVTCKTWSHCTASVLVTFCSAEGEGHCWPGTAFCPYGAYTTDIDASHQMAAFFKKFSLP